MARLFHLPPPDRYSLLLLVLGSLLGSLFLGGCLPYTVGRTAQPAAQGEPVVSSTMTAVPAGAGVYNDEAVPSGSYLLPSVEARFGLDGASDLGVRLLPLGIALDYKRRVAGDSLGRTAALALSGGAGLINYGNHAHFEASVLVSGPERDRTLVPYGGLRAMQALPLNEAAVSDYPTLGVFAGLRIGTRELGVSPELGVFYDPPALNLRDHDVIVVPALTVHGRGLLGALGL